MLLEGPSGPPRILCQITDFGNRSFPVLSPNEESARFLVIGMIGDRRWSAVIAYRDDKIRIISVRRSRESEVGIYESE